jgi:hypothetical protein
MHNVTVNRDIDGPAGSRHSVLHRPECEVLMPRPFFTFERILYVYFELVDVDLIVDERLGKINKLRQSHEPSACLVVSVTAMQGPDRNSVTLAHSLGSRNLRYARNRGTQLRKQSRVNSLLGYQPAVL